MNYQGSCHCGNIAFSVEGDIGEVLACNCSICQRKGSLLWFVPREALKLSTPASNISTYTFHKHAIQHHFCAKCGIHPFGEATMPDGKAMAAVNVRCLENVELESFPVRHFNGRDI